MEQQNKETTTKKVQHDQNPAPVCWCNLLNMRVNRDYTCDAWEREAGTNGQD